MKELTELNTATALDKKACLEEVETHLATIAAKEKAITSFITNAKSTSALQTSLTASELKVGVLKSEKAMCALSLDITNGLLGAVKAERTTCKEDLEGANA